MATIRVQEAKWDDAEEKYSYDEDAQWGRRKINEEDVHSLEAWDEQEEQER